jgi:hypothetical protein
LAFHTVLERFVTLPDTCEKDGFVVRQEEEEEDDGQRLLMLSSSLRSQLAVCQTHQARHVLGAGPDINATIVSLGR